MINNKTIAVVVPAYNEETQIGSVIETMPEYVDRIIIVNDCSKDNTKQVVESYFDKFKSDVIIDIKEDNIEKSKFNEADVVLSEIRKKEEELFTPHEVISKELSKIILINHKKNGGVGAAISTGYKWCRDHNIYCTAVMAGDGQMDPDELEAICLPVINDEVDYVKGNRLIHKSAWYVVPRVRFIGNSVLSILTKVASGYWHISDTQTGYTAISLSALNSIKLYNIYPRYGMPNDLLIKLNMAYCTVKEVPIKPVYRIGEHSKMKINKVIFSISWLLIKGFCKRLWLKYFFRDFHPLFIFYNMTIITFLANIPFTFLIIKNVILNNGTVTVGIYLAFILLCIFSYQSLGLAMWLDIQDNERLYK